MRKLVAFLQSNKKWNIALWIVMALFLLFAFIAIDSKENNLRIRNIHITILPNNELSFLDSGSILALVKGNTPNMMIIGNRLGEMKIDVMEENLERNPFVERADIATDLAGNMHIKIFQRSPLLRVFNSIGQSYYVAKNGYKIPLNEAYTARVITASGNIPESLTDSGFAKTTTLKDLYRIANYCASDKFWEAQIEQLYVDNYNDILLIPKVGNHSIVFGSAQDMEDKFERLKLFYFKGLNNIGWNQYKTINVKFKDQIVAERTGIEIIAADTAR